MSANLENIAREALQLSTAERSTLADRLWMSVHTQQEIDDAWEIEIERRIAQIDAGDVKGVPWETVISKLHDRLNRRAG